MSLNLKNLTADVIIEIAEKIKIGQLLEKLHHEHEILSIKSEIEGIDNSKELERITKEISDLEDQNSERLDESQFLIEIYPKQTQIKNRLEKLEKKRQTIQPEVYEALKEEYLSEFNLLTEQLNTIIKHLEVTRQQIQPLIQVLNFQIEELTVRKDIEELSEDVFNSKYNQLTSDLEEKKKFLTAMEYLLQQVRS